MTRAKFKCVSETKLENDYRKYEFQPVVGGSEENDKFFNTTPGGKIELTVKWTCSKFEVGYFYYIDFTALNELAAASA